MITINLTIFVHQVHHNGPPQGPYLPYPLPPNYNRSAYDDGFLYRNPYGGYYSYNTMLDDAPGICEAILVLAALLLWFYSFYRLYAVWQSTLNFSESSIQGPQGWDLLVNWLVERMRIRSLKVFCNRCSFFSEKYEADKNPKCH